MMALRAGILAAMVVSASMVPSAAAQAKARPVPPPPPASGKAPVSVPVETLSGTLRGAVATHDGQSDWNAVLVGESASWLIVWASPEYKQLKKLAGKRVLVKGTTLTSFAPQGGEPIKLAGTISGLRYDGNLTIGGLGDVVLQPVTALTGMVEKSEEKAGGDPKKSAASYRLVVAGDRPATYVAGATAAKKLERFAGKRVSARCYLNGEAIDEVESVAAAPEPPEPKRVP